MGFHFGFINGVAIGFELYDANAASAVAPDSKGALILELAIFRIIIFKY